MPVCCFSAVLLLQGIIAKKQHETDVRAQRGSGAVPELIHTARAGFWDRDNNGSAKDSWGLPALLALPATLAIDCLCPMPI